jgi:hypothetical protein
MIRKITLFFIVSFLLMSNTFAVTNLVSNGDFSTMLLAPWTLDTGDVFVDDELSENDYYMQIRTSSVPNDLSIDNGGVDYEAMDEVYLSLNGNADAVYIVETVDEDGAVLSLSISQAGTGYTPFESGLLTTTDGSGVGLIVSISSMERSYAYIDDLGLIEEVRYRVNLLVGGDTGYVLFCMGDECQRVDAGAGNWEEIFTKDNESDTVFIRGSQYDYNVTIDNIIVTEESEGGVYVLGNSDVINASTDAMGTFGIDTVSSLSTVLPIGIGVLSSVAIGSYILKLFVVYAGMKG